MPLFEHDESDFDCELLDVEIDALGDIAGLDLLHLVSAIPRETFALAALGASVTAVGGGVDEEQANALAEERGVNAVFESRDLAQLYDAERDNQFGVIYAGPTTLSWIENLNDWSVDVAEALLPGGRLVMYDEHPASRTLEPAETDEEIEGAEEEAAEGEDTDVVIERLWSLDELQSELREMGLVVERLDELKGPQRFLTTQDALGVAETSTIPAAFILVARRPG